MTPKISVLLPTFNYARFLPQAIESVLEQSEENFELIIRDDDSSDESPAVIARYALRDDRIRVLSGDRNLGLVGNWNACLAEARGEYVKYIFGDDCLLRRDALSRYAAALDRHPHAALVASSRLVIDDQNRVEGVWNEFAQAGESSGRQAIARCLWTDKNLIGEPTAVMFRRVLGRRGFDATLRQVVDLEMWFHLLLRGTIVFEPTPLCAFRVHARQQTARNRELHLGVLESLQLTARYLPQLEREFTRASTARVVHRTLHYSRKRNPRTPAILEAEDALSRLTTRFQLRRCAIAHRLVRPWQNLQRLFSSRHRSRLQPWTDSWAPLCWSGAERHAPAETFSA